MYISYNPINALSEVMDAALVDEKLTAAKVQIFGALLVESSRCYLNMMIVLNVCMCIYIYVDGLLYSLIDGGLFNL